MRQVGTSLVECELTHMERAPIDLERARTQHEAYHRLLLELGWQVTMLPALKGFPDAVFVEDTAVVLDEIAIMCRCGALSRRGEVASVRRSIEPLRPVIAIEAPGTIDGGDVLVIGKRIWIGQTSRTNTAAVDQVRTIVEPLGYEVTTVPVRGCLHLKSAASAANAQCVVVNENWVDPAVFGGLDVIGIDADEPYAANVLALGEQVVVASTFPRTRRRIEAHGLDTRSLEADELAKAEGALTCCSIMV
jgi:dimethylargininase